MKKFFLLLFDMFLVNFLLFLYLFTMGKMKVVEGGGTDWFFSSVLLSGIGGLMDMIALVVASVLMILLFKNKLEKNYIYIYITLALLTATAFIFKIRIGLSLFDLHSSIKPIAVVTFSVLLSIIYLIDFYKKVEEKTEVVGAIFIGANDEQNKKLMAIASSGASVKTVDDLVKLNKTVTSKVTILVDMPVKEVEKVMAYLSFTECRVAYLHSSNDTRPNFEKKSLDKWYESHEFVVSGLDEFASEFMFNKL